MSKPKPTTLPQALGALVHRAALMPAQKPFALYGRQQHQKRWQLYLEQAKAGAEALKDELSDTSDGWTPLRCIIDAGGPFWDRLVDDIRISSLSVKRNCIRRLLFAAKNASAGIKALGMRDDNGGGTWYADLTQLQTRWMWFQSELLQSPTPAELGALEKAGVISHREASAKNAPTHWRVDVEATVDDGSIEIIELKTVATLPAMANAADLHQVSKYCAWRAMRALDGTQVQGRVLYSATEPQSDDALFVIFDLPETWWGACPSRPPRRQ